MRRLVIRVVGLGLRGAMTCGCMSEPPSVERVPVASPDNRDSRIEYDRPKPLPDDAKLWDRDRR